MRSESNQPPLDCEATTVTIHHRDITTHADLKAESSPTAGTPDRPQKTYHDIPSITAQSSSFPPIHRLPPEVFSEIFLRYASDLEQVGIQRPPFLLIHVCRSWRDAGLSTHHLWNTVPVIDLDSPRSSEKEYNDILRPYLRWSGDIPLSIYLLNTTSIFSLHPALDTVISHSHRWRDVVITINVACLHALSAIRGCLSVMRSLKLTLHGQASSSDIFEIAPKLHVVEVQSNSSQDWLKLPWPQLEQYSGILSDPPKFLRNSSQLSVCKLRAASVEEHHFNSETSPARLGDLRSLSLSHGYRVVSWRHTTELFEGLVLPALEHFRLLGPEPPICDLLIPFITRSACFLRSLTLHKVGFLEGELARLLMLTPVLEELDIKPIPPYWPFDFLIFSPTNPPFVPSLRLLTVHHYSGVGSTLLEVIRSRCDQNAHTISRLGCARLVFNPKYRPNPDYPLGQNHPKSGKYLGWRNQLNIKFFGKQSCASSKKLHIKPLAINRLFLEIEQQDTLDPELLRCSGLNLLMRKVSQSSPTQILGDVKFNFRTRAGALVEKWTPSLVEHAKTCRWIAEGETDLVYASGPEYRNNDDRDLLIDLAFGRSRTSRDREEDW